MSNLPQIHRIVRIGGMSNYFDTFAVSRKIPTTENQKLLVNGIAQRNNVVPKDASVEKNIKQIGFIQSGDLNTASEENIIRIQRDDMLGRIARIYLKDTNHMQSTPSKPKGYKWVVELERQAIYKTPWMGWTFAADSYSKRQLYFPQLEDAITYCRKMGFGYDINYHRFRYVTRQSYSDNFKFKGAPVLDDPDS